MTKFWWLILSIAAGFSLLGLVILGYLYGGFFTLIYFAVGLTVGASAAELRQARGRCAKRG